LSNNGTVTIMEGKQFIGAVLLVLSIALIAGCTSQSEQTVAKNDTVSVDYIGWLDNGTVFDTSNATLAKEAGIYDENITYEPITFVVGSGEVITGFDNGVVGLKVNESRNITLTPDEAYGDYDASLIQPVNTSDLLENNITPYVNETLYYGTNPVTIYSIPNNTTVMIDFNHPLAGKTLHFKLTVLSITPPSAS